MFAKYPMSYLEGLSDIMLSTQTLTPGKQYTFTFQKGGFFSFDFSSDADIIQGLKDRMGNYGEIVGVSRPFASNRWVVNVIPTVPVTVDQSVSAFDTSWKDMGYDNITFWRSESGIESTAPGGMSEVLPKAAEVIGGVTGKIFKPLVESIKPILPYLIIGGGLFLYVVMRTYIPAPRRN